LDPRLRGDKEGRMEIKEQKAKLVLISFHLPFVEPDNTAKRSEEKCITLERIKDKR
jgi:hypothetical protein